MDQEIQYAKYSRAQAAMAAYTSREAMLKVQSQSLEEYVKVQDKFKLYPKMLIVDSTDQHPQDQIPLTHYKAPLNAKYCLKIPQIAEHDLVIVNPIVFGRMGNTSQFEIVEVTDFRIPVAQRQFLREQDIDETHLQTIVNYIQQHLLEEQDIVIYCEDINQMDHLRLLFRELSGTKVVVLIDDDIVMDLQSKIYLRQQNARHTIFLLLEAQYVPSRIVSLIVHCQRKQILSTTYGQTVVQSYVPLTHQQLIVREYCRSSITKVVYNYSQEEFLDLQIHSEYQSNQVPDYSPLLKECPNQAIQQLLIIVSMLSTEGSLLSTMQQHKDSFKNKHLIVRTSPFWSRAGDPFSWITILSYIAARIDRLDELQGEQLLREQVYIEKWCNDQVVNITKVLLALAFMQRFAEIHNLNEHSLLTNLHQPPKLIKRQSSFNAAQIDEKLIEDLLLQHFQVATLKQNKVYSIEGKDLAVNSDSIQKLLGYYASSVAVIGLQGDQLLYTIKASRRKQSLQFKEIVFPNQGYAILHELWKNDGKEVLVFEEAHNCIVEPNIEINQISILCHDGEEDLKSQFNALIQLKKQNLQSEVKIVPFHNNTKMILKQGGLVDEWIKESKNKTFVVNNLGKETIEQEVRELFEEYATLRQVKLKYSATACSAEVTVENAEDIPYIVDDFEDAEYNGHILRINYDKQVHQKQQHKFNKHLLEIFWYAKLSRGTAIVDFYTAEDALNVFNQLNGQLLDGNVLSVKQTDGSSVIQIRNINKATTDYDLIQFCGGQQKVKQLQHDCQSMIEPKIDFSSKIEGILKGIVKKGKETEILSIKKKNDGLRLAKVIVFENVPPVQIQAYIDEINGMKISINSSDVKLYCRVKYRQQHKLQPIIKSILTESLKEYNEVSHEFKSKFQETQQLNSAGQFELNLILFISTYSQMLAQKLNVLINTVIQGRTIELQGDISIMFSQFGQLKLRSLEDQYQVKFLNDRFKKILRTYCPDQLYPIVAEEIQQFITQKTVLKIPITLRQVKLINGIDAQGLENFANEYNVTIRYDNKYKELHLEGQAIDLDQAKSGLQQLMQVETNTQEFAKQICGYCCDDMKHGYLLQQCGHKFCMECLQFALMNNLNDVGSLPIKCPECQQTLVLEDILIILGESNFDKLTNVAVNKYVQENVNKVSFCFTPDCPNLVQLQGNIFECALCSKSYCILCKALYHPGLTCEENKIGDLVLLKRFMEKEDIRKCPNCKTLLQRISGCYRITCNSCQKSICWKNKKDDTPCMLVFPNAGECYQHLDKVHGGYF